MWDDSLETRSGANQVCSIYVESDMYHVLVWFSSPISGDCIYGGMPPFSPLLWAELV